MTKKPKKLAASAAKQDMAVEAFMKTINHPGKADMLAVRKLLLSADASITEGIKWNAPSFRTTEWFATINTRAKSGVEVILHFGAKKNAISRTGVHIPDPAALLKWLGNDRAIMRLRDAQDIAQRSGALTALVQAWIKHVK